MKIEVSILREIGAKRILRCTTTIGEKQSFSIGVGEAVTVSEFLRVMVDHLTKKCIIVSEKEFIVVVLVGDHPKRLEDEEKLLEKMKVGKVEMWEGCHLPLAERKKKEEKPKEQEKGEELKKEIKVENPKQIPKEKEEETKPKKSGDWVRETGKQNQPNEKKSGEFERKKKEENEQENEETSSFSVVVVGISPSGEEKSFPSPVSASCEATIEEVLQSVLESVPTISALHLDIGRLKIGHRVSGKRVQVPHFMNFRDSNRQIQDDLVKMKKTEITLQLSKPQFDILKKSQRPISKIGLRRSSDNIKLKEQEEMRNPRCVTPPPSSFSPDRSNSQSVSSSSSPVRDDSAHSIHSSVSSSPSSFASPQLSAQRGSSSSSSSSSPLIGVRRSISPLKVPSNALPLSPSLSSSPALSPSLSPSSPRFHSPPSPSSSFDSSSSSFDSFDDDELRKGYQRMTLMEEKKGKKERRRKNFSAYHRASNYSETLGISGSALSRNPSPKSWFYNSQEREEEEEFPVFERNCFHFNLNGYHDRLKSYHSLFNAQSLLEEISHLFKSGDSRFESQKVRELQEIASFRSRIATIFSDFDPKQIPEMTTDFVMNRPAVKENSLKMVDILFYFSKNVMDNASKSKLILSKPLRAAVRRVIQFAGDSCPIPSASDAVLRRVGRKEYIWDLDIPLYAYDFAVEAYEKRQTLQFFVTSKEEMTKEGLVFDESNEFKKKGQKILLENLNCSLMKEDISGSEIDKIFGEKVSRPERVYDSRDVKNSYSLKINSILNLSSNERKVLPSDWFQEDKSHGSSIQLAVRNFYCFVQVQFFHGNNPLTEELYSPLSKTGNWTGNEKEIAIINTNISLSSFPLESVVCLTLFATKEVKKGAPLLMNAVPLGGASLAMTDETRRFKFGKQYVSLWPKYVAKCDDCLGANPDLCSIILHFEFPTFKRPIVHLMRSEESYQKRVEEIQKAGTHIPSEKRDFDLLKKTLSGLPDSILPLTEEDKTFIWKNRGVVRSFFIDQIPRLFSSCPFREHDELRALLDPSLPSLEEEISPAIALELLHRKYASGVVRSFAVKCLTLCSESELGLWMLQLVQALKCEVRHFSPLSYFLIHRALHSKKLGISFFWMLVAELSVFSEGEEIMSNGPSFSTRFFLYLDVFLNFCGEETIQVLRDQLKLMKDLCGVAQGVQEVKNASGTEQMKKDRNAKTKLLLADLKIPSSFTLPTDSDRDLSSFVIDKCKAMVSAAAPIWLTFQSAEADANPYIVIFKKGDDLRKDILVLQLFRTMNYIWRRAGLDLRMTPYEVVMTGSDSGLVKVVTNSATCAHIQKLEGGGVRGAFKSSCLVRWLEKMNQTDAHRKQAVENFISSCAGYCVATYVLGIGDRHNDNIMVTETGLFFHIDFAHILGDKLKFGIIDRETAPFILTKEFVRVMGGETSEGFSKFANFCVRAYLLLRKNVNLIISLFTMMLSSGIPGLSIEDLRYLRTSLALDMTEDEAGAHFQKLIRISLKSLRTLLNFGVHIAAN